MSPGPRAQPRAAAWVVEDSTLYRDTIRDLLDQSGRLRCGRTFADAETALAALDDGRDLPRIVLMDLGLPGMSGVDCARLIRMRSPSIPVVMLTVHQSNDRIFDALCAGASGYLLKSASREALLRGLENVLDGGAAMDAQIARRVLDMFARMATPQADYGLSRREHEILELLVEGNTKQRVAERLALSPHTIDGHVRNIYSKLHVNSRSGAVAKALRENLLS
ncbi:MAG TPA: response regulator transcription factor [Gemmatimonadales bacterium]|nr:response regulator transcription factor [Gemmatimonadales bacterium]